MLATAKIFTHRAHDASWQNRMNDGAGMYVTATCSKSLMPGLVDFKGDACGIDDEQQTQASCSADGPSQGQLQVTRLSDACLIENEQHTAAQTVCHHQECHQHDV